MILNHLTFPIIFKGQPTSSIHQFTVNGIEGKPIAFSQLAGKKLLIVNTASECGLTPQFEQLEALHKKYAATKNLVIIGFPSNDFGAQDPGSNEEIKSFCQRNYGVSFLMAEKIHVKGDSIHPLYRWLTTKKLNGVLNSTVKWNFQKYLIDEDGHLVTRVLPWRKPNTGKIIRWLEKT